MLERFTTLIIPVFLLLVGATSFFWGLSVFLRSARQQHKLYNSIRLVDLRQRKLFLLVVVTACLALSLYCAILMATPNELASHLKMGALEASLSLSGIMLVLGTIATLTAQQFFIKSAIVDKGVYVGVGFIDWHHVYHYYVDAERCTVILSTDKHGTKILHGTTIELRFNKQDLEKIEFILGKNKNKFAGFELKNAR